MGLSGVGDLIATGGSSLSRNYRVGYGLGQGRALPEILEELGQVAEGVPTTRVLCALAHKSGIEMPLCMALHRVLFEAQSPSDVINELMLRPLKDEGSHA
jgi:glycerol-3-phosphate dehydrogenase (NAD(P)+)